MDYADAVNAEAHALFAAGVDIVQFDEPYLQARSDKARAYAVKALNRAIRGISGKTALHICFGYAHVHKGAAKPNGYSYLEELEETAIDIISIEAAQPHPADRCRAYSRSAAAYPGRTAHDRAGLRNEISFARDCLRQAEGDGRRSENRPRRARMNPSGRRYPVDKQFVDDLRLLERHEMPAVFDDLKLRTANPAMHLLLMGQRDDSVLPGEQDQRRT